MSRRVGIAVGLATAAGLSGGWMALDRARASAHKSPYKLEKARVERGDVTGRVTATGTLTALVTVQVGSQVSGRIAELIRGLRPAREKGQVIAKLDARMFAAQAEQGRANREAAAGDLEKARAQAEEAEQQVEAHADAGRSEPGRARRAGRRGHGRQGGARGGRGGGRQPLAGDGRLQPGEGQPRLHDDRVADQRHRHLAQRRRGADGGGVAAGAHAVHDRGGPGQDAGPRGGRPRRTSAGWSPACRRRSSSTPTRSESSRASSGRSATRRRRCRTSSPTTRSSTSTTRTCGSSPA